MPSKTFQYELLLLLLLLAASFRGHHGHCVSLCHTTLSYVLLQHLRESVLPLLLLPGIFILSILLPIYSASLLPSPPPPPYVHRPSKSRLRHFVVICRHSQRSSSSSSTLPPVLLSVPHSPIRTTQLVSLPSCKPSLSLSCTLLSHITPDTLLWIKL